MNEPSTTQLTPEEQLAERERAIALLEFLPETKSYTLTCQYTGVTVATMQLLMQAGKVPYLSQWKESLAVHPLFSLPPHQILSWTRKNWNRLFKQSSDSATQLEKQQFQIAFVAVLHTFDSIKQECPVLPSFETVARNMQRLLEMAYWRLYLDSKRFKFPPYRITRFNNNFTLEDIHAYLDVCYSKRVDWETSKDAQLEDAKLEIARKMEKAVAASHVRAVPRKGLWNWFVTHLVGEHGKRYEQDDNKKWLEETKEMFLASESKQLRYTVDDCNELEELFLSCCPIGNVISHTFQNELNKIRDNIRTHQELFEIDWMATLNPKVRRTDAEGNIIGTGSPEIAIPRPAEPGPEPQLEHFHNRIDYIKATAKWRIMTNQYRVWMEKYGAINAQQIKEETNDTIADVDAAEDHLEEDINLRDSDDIGLEPDPHEDEDDYR